MDNLKEQAFVLDPERTCAVAVLGNAVTGHYALIDLDQAKPVVEASALEARERGLEFVGVMGVKDGVADAICEPGPGALSLMCAAVWPFVTQYAAKLGQKSDGTEWLEWLHALPDTRTDN